jgi:hypothetical protein
MGKEVSDYTAQKVQEGQTSLMKRINKAWITGVIAGISAGVLMAYISWESTGRQGKLTEYTFFLSDYYFCISWGFVGIHPGS